MPRSANVLSFISSKGGSGKTVTSASLGTFLSELGFRVLLIDADAATNGLTLLFLEQLLSGTRVAGKARGLGLFEASERRPAATVKLKENLYLVPAATHLTNTDGLAPDIFYNNLKSILDNSKNYDVVLIDAQAGVDQYASISAALSDVHVIVSEYDPVSAQGIDRLKIVFSGALASDNTYTLFNKVLPEFAEVIGDGLSIARYLPPIPWDAEVVRAFSRRDLAINLQAPNAYTLAISQISLACLADLTGSVIENWRGEALARATDPIEHRLAILNRTKGIRLARNRKNLLVRRYAILSVAVIGGVFTLALFSVQAFGLFAKGDESPIWASLGIAFASLSLLLLDNMYRSLPSLKNDAEVGYIQEEIEKLTTSLLAARATMRVSEPGLYSLHRRRESERTN